MQSVQVVLVFSLSLAVSLGGCFAHYNAALYGGGDVILEAQNTGVVSQASLSPLAAFTACLWLRLELITGSVVLLNYNSSLTNPSEIFIECSNQGIQLAVDGSPILVEDNQLAANQWTFICAQWANNDGKTSLFVNGQRIEHTTNQKQGHVLPGGEVTVQIGYTTAEKLKGRMTCVNIWDSVLRPAAIGRLYRDHVCRYDNDTLLTWLSITNQLIEGQLFSPSELYPPSCSIPKIPFGDKLTDTVIVGHVISTVSVVSDLHCLDHCLREHGCIAYNILLHDAKRTQCQLLSSFKELRQQNDSYARMFNRDQTQQVLLASCSQITDNRRGKEEPPLP